MLIGALGIGDLVAGALVGATRRVKGGVSKLCALRAVGARKLDLDCSGALICLCTDAVAVTVQRVQLRGRERRRVAAPRARVTAMFTDSTQWDRVCTFSADKLNELGQVSLFAKKLHALEAEHARDLAKLCEKFLSGVPAEKRGVLERVMAAAAAEQDDDAEEREEPPISLGATWASVLEEMALRARRAELVADRLDAQVVRPLGQHILELDVS